MLYGMEQNMHIGDQQGYNEAGTEDYMKLSTM